MPRRKAWNGRPPRSRAEARRYLLDIALGVVERVGIAKAGLSDVAEAAGVTRQTVYRYFESAEDLFNSAAALSSGGFHQQMRARVLAQPTMAERIVECLVYSALKIPGDPHLAVLTKTEHFTVSNALRLSFIQEEMGVLAEGDTGLTARDRDELAEILLRLLHSYLSDAGEPRTEDEMRAYLQRWLVPMIEARVAANR